VFFQPNTFDIFEYMPFILAGVLLAIGVIILKVALVATKAESKTNMKWVAGSFFIQYGVTLFISLPIQFDMIIAVVSGSFNNYQGPPPSTIAMVVIFATFIVVNLINTIHKPGIKRSIIITLLIIGPIIGSSYLIFSNIATVL
jgi:hypothetical protein